MKIPGFCLGLLVASLTSACAQVTVEVTQEQQQFLPGEALKVAVRITNLSGQDLHLGGEQDWLTFALESREGPIVPKTGDAPVLGEFVLESSKVATKRVDLAPYFTLTHPGRYEIVATLRIRDWNRDLTSPPCAFDLLEGTRLWEQEVGVPRSASDPNSPPEVRRYILQQASYLRGQLRLYLRVTDVYGRPIRVFPVGPMVSFSRPEPQVDRLSHLHVLYQDGPFSFNYTVCNLQGEVITRQTYDYLTSRPRLRVDDQGAISVMGGVRRITANDLPASKTDDTAADAQSAGAAARSPGPTNQLNVVKTPRS